MENLRSMQVIKQDLQNNSSNSIKQANSSFGNNSLGNAVVIPNNKVLNSSKPYTNGGALRSQLKFDY
jgi:hypothetical protein